MAKIGSCCELVNNSGSGADALSGDASIRAGCFLIKNGAQHLRLFYTPDRLWHEDRERPQCTAAGHWVVMLIKYHPFPLIGCLAL